MKHTQEILCPHCKSSDLQKNGHSENGTQRWRCVQCRKSFLIQAKKTFFLQIFSLIDIIYLPHKYVKYAPQSTKEKPKVTVQIELDEDKKDKVLELIFEGKEFDFL